MGLEIDDPYAKERRKLNFSLTGSEWAIQDYLPHIFDNDDENGSF